MDRAATEGDEGSFRTLPLLLLFEEGEKDLHTRQGNSSQLGRGALKAIGLASTWSGRSSNGVGLVARVAEDLLDSSTP